MENLSQLHNTDWSVTPPKKARELTSNHLHSLPRTTLVAFTDGSSLQNPGPCGSAAILYTHGLSQEPVSLNRPVSLKSSAFHGELDAIALALEFVVTFCSRNDNDFNTLSIHTDCKSALQTVLNGVKSNFTSLAASIEDSITALETQNINTELTWVAGHAGLLPNKLGDAAAKKAALSASQWNREQDTGSKSFSEVKRAIRNNTVNAWQQGWSRQNDGRHTYGLLPKVTIHRQSAKLDRPTEIKVNRLLSGHSLLAEHASRMKLPTNPTPACPCGADIESVDHYLLHCRDHTSHRENLIATIERKYQSSNIPFHLRLFDVRPLLGDNSSLY